MISTSEIEILWVAPENKSTPLFLTLIEEAIGIKSTHLPFLDSNNDFLERTKNAGLLICSERPEDAIQIAKRRPNTKATTVLLCKTPFNLGQLIDCASSVPDSLFHKKSWNELRIRSLLSSLLQKNYSATTFWGSPDRVIEREGKMANPAQRYKLHDLVSKKCLNRIPPSLRSRLTELTMLPATDSGLANHQAFTIDQWNHILTKLNPKLADETALVTELDRDFKEPFPNRPPPLRSENELVAFAQRSFTADLSFTKLAWNLYAPLWQYDPIEKWYEIDRKRQIDTAPAQFQYDTSRLAIGQLEPEQIDQIEKWTKKQLLLAIQACRQGGQFENSLSLARIATELKPNETELKRELAISHVLLDNIDQANEAKAIAKTTSATLLHQRYLWHINNPEKLNRPTSESIDSFLPDDPEAWVDIFDPSVVLTHQLFQGSTEQALKTLKKALTQFPKQEGFLATLASLRAIATGNLEFISQIPLEPAVVARSTPLGQLICRIVIASARQQKQVVQTLWNELSKRSSQLMLVQSADNYNLIYYISIALKLLGHPNRSQNLENLSAPYAPQQKISKDFSKSIPPPLNHIENLPLLPIEQR